MPFLRKILVVPALLVLGVSACTNNQPAEQARQSSTAATSSVAAAPASEHTMTVYKSPTCGCCNKWIDHMTANGFKVEGEDMANVAPLKVEKGIPSKLFSCHTGVIDGYVVEGHVPADAVKKLLDERPDIIGLSVPGMPIGSPGMEGAYVEKYDVVAFRQDGSSYVFKSY